MARERRIAREETELREMIEDYYKNRRQILELNYEIGKTELFYEMAQRKLEEERLKRAREQQILDAQMEKMCERIERLKQGVLDYAAEKKKSMEKTEDEMLLEHHKKTDESIGILKKQIEVWAGPEQKDTKEDKKVRLEHDEHVKKYKSSRMDEQKPSSVGDHKVKHPEEKIPEHPYAQVECVKDPKVLTEEESMNEREKQEREKQERDSAEILAKLEQLTRKLDGWKIIPNKKKVENKEPEIVAPVKPLNKPIRSAKKMAIKEKKHGKFESEDKMKKINLQIEKLKTGIKEYAEEQQKKKMEDQKVNPVQEQQDKAEQEKQSIIAKKKKIDNLIDKLKLGVREYAAEQALIRQQQQEEKYDSAP